MSEADFVKRFGLVRACRSVLIAELVDDADEHSGSESLLLKFGRLLLRRR
jgi:hypothetical protein